MTRFFWIAAVGLVSATILLSIPLFSLFSLPDLQGDASAVGSPALSATRTETKQFRADGTLYYRLSVASTVYLSEQNQVHLESPSLLIYPDDDQTAWHIKAQNGSILTASGDNLNLLFPDLSGSLGNIANEVVLSGNVEVKRTDSGQRIHLTTAELSFRPATQIASTDTELMISFQGGQITAQSGSADLAAGSLELAGTAEQPVQSTYREAANAENNLRVSSDRLSVAIENDSISLILATGEPVRFYQTPTDESKPVTGSALQMAYDPGRYLLSLEHEASVNQGQRALHGDIILYNPRTRTVRVKSFE